MSAAFLPQLSADLYLAPLQGVVGLPLVLVLVPAQQPTWLPVSGVQRAGRRSAVLLPATAGVALAVACEIGFAARVPCPCLGATSGAWTIPCGESKVRNEEDF